MRDYTYRELGMLSGTILGGALAVLLFCITQNAVLLSVTVLGLTAGIAIGSMLDKKLLSVKGREEKKI